MEVYCCPVHGLDVDFSGLLTFHRHMQQIPVQDLHDQAKPQKQRFVPLIHPLLAESKRVPKKRES